MLIDNRELPLIGLGTYGMGGTNQEADTTHDQRDIAALRYAFDRGFRFVTGAEVYGATHTDELIGKAIHGYDDLIVASKLGEYSLTHPDIIPAAARNIARRLGRRISLLSEHWHYPGAVMEEYLPAMHRLTDLGIVGDIGVSNLNAEQLQQAIDITDALNAERDLTWQRPYRIAAIENVFSPLNRGGGLHKTVHRPQPGFSPELRTLCRAHGIAEFSYTSIYKGDKGELAHNAIIKEIARAHDASVYQIAISWLVSQGIIPLVKSSQPRHIDDNWNALRIQLSDEEIALINSMASEKAH